MRALPSNTVSLALALLAVGCRAPTDAAGDSGAGSADGVQWSTDDAVESILHVRWSQDIDANSFVAYRVAGEEWRQTPVEQRSAGDQEALLLGLPYDADVELQVNIDGVVDDSAAAQTGPIPREILQPAVIAADDSAWEPNGNFLLTTYNSTRGGWASGDFYMLILDRQGRVVWAWLVDDQNFSLNPRVSLDGDHLLWDELSYWTAYDEGRGSVVHRTTLTGALVETIPTPGANHAFAELPDESVAWHAMTDSDLANHDARLDVVDDKGDVQTLWRCAELDGLPPTATCLSNTVFWSEARRSYLTSFAMEDFVLELDDTTGEVLRAFGDLDGAYAFDPPDSAFYTQHGVTFTDAGTLLVSTHSSYDSNEVIVREYEVDDDAQVLRQIWSQGEGDGIEASLGGDAFRLPGGNTLHDFGVTARIQEVTPAGDIVWDVQWPEDHLIGSARFIEDLYTLQP